MERHIAAHAVVYHHTDRAGEYQIAARGFRDSETTYLAGAGRRGVWVSDRPLAESEDAAGDVVFRVVLQLPTPDALDAYEWREDGQSYREWCVPAALLNEWGTPTVVDESNDPPLPLAD